MFYVRFRANFVIYYHTEEFIFTHFFYVETIDLLVPATYFLSYIYSFWTFHFVIHKLCLWHIHLGPSLYAPLMQFPPPRKHLEIVLVKSQLIPLAPVNFGEKMCSQYFWGRINRHTEIKILLRLKYFTTFTTHLSIIFLLSRIWSWWQVNRVTRASLLPVKQLSSCWVSQVIFRPPEICI